VVRGENPPTRIYKTVLPSLKDRPFPFYFRFLFLFIRPFPSLNPNLRPPI